MNQQGKLEQWDERQNKDSESFEWYQRWKDITTFFKKNNINLKNDEETPIYPFNENNKVLIIGCGTSRMYEELFDDGIKNITNIDQSQNLINKMTEKRDERLKETVIFELKDVKNTGQEDNTQDVIIDKACLDAILCGQDSFANATKTIHEIHRILNYGGVQILISNGNPDSRKHILRGESIEVVRDDGHNPIDWDMIQEYSIAKPVNSKVPDNLKKDNTLNSHQIQILTKKKKPVEVQEEN